MLSSMASLHGYEGSWSGSDPCSDSGGGVSWVADESYESYVCGDEYWIRAGPVTRSFSGHPFSSCRPR